MPEFKQEYDSQSEAHAAAFQLASLIPGNGWHGVIRPYQVSAAEPGKPIRFQDQPWKYSIYAYKQLQDTGAAGYQVQVSIGFPANPFVATIYRNGRPNGAEVHGKDPLSVIVKILETRIDSARKTIQENVPVVTEFSRCLIELMEVGK